MRELAGPMSRWCGENPTGMPGRFRRVPTDSANPVKRWHRSGLVGGDAKICAQACPHHQLL